MNSCVEGGRQRQSSNAWIDWAKANGAGLDFNPTYFAHRNAADGFTLAHPDRTIRQFWIEHGIACRRIGAAFGSALGSPCNRSSRTESNVAGDGKAKLTIALMPKSKGNGYFVSCKKGADEAARALNVELLFDGPTEPDPARQNEIIENWITIGVDVIAAACENKEGISTALRKAQQKGIKVITYDSDSAPDARAFFVNQATPEGIGNTLMDEAARLTNAEGEFAVITASLTASNMASRRSPAIRDGTRHSAPNARVNRSRHRHVRLRAPDAPCSKRHRFHRAGDD